MEGIYKVKNFPKDIPVAVGRVYKDQGFKNLPDFLGRINIMQNEGNFKLPESKELRKKSSIKIC